MPSLTSLIDKFLTRATLTTQDKTDLRGDIDALKNDAASVLELLEGEVVEFAGLQLPTSNSITDLNGFND